MFADQGIQAFVNGMTRLDWIEYPQLGCEFFLPVHRDAVERLVQVRAQ